MPLLLMLWFSVVVPKNTIMIKGAAPGVSDPATPVPEDGRVAERRYRNAYFGLSYPIPAGWSEQPAGPPPSDGGAYVLAQFAAPRVHVLVTAQDLFFGERPIAGVPPQFEAEGGPDEVTIGGRKFS